MSETIETLQSLAILPFATEKAWNAWLRKNGNFTDGIWLKFSKKGSGIASVSYDKAVEVALCYGWIDGQKKSYDELYWLQRFTPRRKNSVWSEVNKNKALALINAGKMQPSGLAAIEDAKANGRWDAAYAPTSTAQVPDDLALALKKNKTANRFFEGLDKQNRYAILYRIQAVKKPENRAKKIVQFIEMLAKGEKIYPK